MKKPITTHGSVGRPKSTIKAKHPDTKAFFELADRLGLSLEDLTLFLKKHVANPPSYRTLQEWRRGTHHPKYVSFKEWIELLKQSKQKTTNDQK